MAYRSRNTFSPLSGPPLTLSENTSRISVSAMGSFFLSPLYLVNSCFTVGFSAPVVWIWQNFTSLE